MSSTPNKSPIDPWPAIRYADWKDTCTTLHLWSQVVGKIRLAKTPWTNHSWHVPLYVSGRGLTTTPIPFGERGVEIEFDFIEHLLRIDTCDGVARRLPLEPRSVADFYAAVLGTLEEIGLPVHIHETPNEIAEAIPFSQDHVHASYDAGAAHCFWRALVECDRVLKQFRTGFLGKCSPVHFFWGSFDLAVTRFSGRRAPSHPGGVPNLPDAVAREAYSHEVSSAGFWPGGAGVDDAMFYSYAYPTPPGFENAPVRPEGAYFHPTLREFVLPYEVVRTASDPDATLLAFLQTTYEAAADGAKWDRAALEGPPGVPGVPRPIG